MRYLTCLTLAGILTLLLSTPGCDPSSPSSASSAAKTDLTRQILGNAVEDALLASLMYQGSGNPTDSTRVSIAIWGDGVVVWHSDGTYRYTSITTERTQQVQSELMETGLDDFDGAAYAMPSSSWWEIRATPPGREEYRVIWDERSYTLPSRSQAFSRKWRAARSLLEGLQVDDGQLVTTNQQVLNRFKSTFFPIEQGG